MSRESKIESRSKDLNFYPEKPKTESGFKKAVAWFGGREFIASLKDMLMYGIFGENLDPRSWMNPNIYPNLVKKIINQKEIDIQFDIEKKKNPENPNIDVLYTSISAEASKIVKEDAKIRQEIYLKIEQEWAKRLYDQWEWKRNNYALWEEFQRENPEFWSKLQPKKVQEKKKIVAEGETQPEPDEKYLDEFWFDYISDSGDGQMGVYNVACMCLSDLWLDEDLSNQSNPEKVVRFRPPNVTGLDDKIFLPRGSFLFVGGDTAYHSANYSTLVDRFQIPFRWAFTSVRDFADEAYTLKPEKKAEAEAALIKQLGNPESDPDNTNLLESLKGSLPGSINNLEYSDTEPTRPILGIPANHDYYDGIDGFNRQFRRPPFENTEENQISDDSRGKFLLQIPTFSRKQEASYMAICLPFEWWMFGIDSENEKLDFRQELYFTEIIERYKPKKLIMATPEPTTVFGKKCDAEDKTATYLKAITKGLGLSQPFLTNGIFEKDAENTSGEAEKTEPDLSGNFCRLDLSGDIHHYARYWGKDTRELVTLDKKGKNYQSENYASVVAGGGGAFFDVTKTLIGKPLNQKENPIFKSRDKKNKEIKGEIPPQEVFPSEEDSISKTADKLFDVWNLRNGGYVQYVGFAIATILFYFLTHFSNFSFVVQSYRNSSLKQICSIAFNHLFISICLLALTGFFIYKTVSKVHKLIEDLKLRSFKNTLKKNYDATMKQLAWKYIWFIPSVIFFGLALYNIFYNRDLTGQDEHLNNFLISCNLIVVFVIFFLLIQLSAEHTNWLAVRFKINRKSKRKTITQKYEDPNEHTRSRIKKILGFLSRFYSYQYFLSNALIFAAFALLVTGINLFGAVSIARTLADLLLVSVVVGIGLLIILVFARNIGAMYHKSFKYKSLFTIFGIWHYILQLATPLVLFFFGSRNYLLLNFLIVGILNGSGFISFLIRHYLAKNDRKSKWEAVADFRIAAVMTKYLNRYVLFAVWLFYGTAILLYPLLNNDYIEVNGKRMKNSIYNSIYNYFANDSTSSRFYEFFQRHLSDFYNVTTDIFDKQFAAYCTIWVSILVIGYIGYLMSRVWLGWYLAIAMHFDGHNNEAGGAARIEGFKHMLRIKVTRENITVYVIGFDEAQAEMSKMEMKLVDKFTLTPKPIS